MLRVLEKRMLTGGALDRVVDAATGHEAMRMLSQNSSFDFAPVEQDGDYEIVLRQELVALYDMAYQLCHDERAVDILAAKYDFHNLKVAFKAQHTGTDAEELYLPVSRVLPKTIAQIVADPRQAPSCPPHLIKAAEGAKAAFSEKGDPQALDIELDRALYAHMADLAKALENELIARYVATLIDFHNLKTLLRVKNMQKGPRFLAALLVPGGTVEPADYLQLYDKPVDAIGESLHYKHFGDALHAALERYDKTGNFAALEKAADNALIRIAQDSKYVPYGQEVLFAYIAAKENEFKQVRILLTCKFNHIPDDVIRERLRENYA